MALGWLWWRAWGRLVVGDATVLCVAGVALGDILRFAWQAWHLWHWAGSGGALGRGWARLVASDAAVLCAAGVALGDIHRRFAWQAWHLWHWAGSGRAGSPGAPRHLEWQAWHLMTSTFVLRGMRGTW